MMNGMMFSKNICTKFVENDESFEEYRNIALNDLTNPNIQDFTHDKLDIAKHISYAIVLNGNDPIFMGGLYKIHEDIGRLQNRFYIFPKYRAKTKSQIIEIGKLSKEYLLEPMISMSPFKTHIMTMTNRGVRNNHFNTFYRSWNIVWPNHWKLINGYIQTSKGMKKRSWQNAITDNIDHDFKTLNHDQWLLLSD